jgi:CDP-4-dehydro-6-deoxyglucose reductase
LIADGVIEVGLDVIDAGKLNFRPGQFVTISFPAGGRGSEARKRLSIASLNEREDSLRFIVRLMPDAPGSDPFGTLAVGAEVRVTAPQGSFVLNERHEGDVVFAVTGTALAPVLAMLRELAERGDAGRRLVYWGLRRESDVFVPEEIAHRCACARATLHVYLSQPSPAWNGLRGRITDAVVGALPSLTAPTFYVVGNRAMVHELKDKLLERGIDRRKQIRTEAFVE